MLSLLSLLSVWLDLNALDLHLYLHLPKFLFDQFNRFLLFSCKCLKKFKLSLYKQLNVSQRNSQGTRRF